MDIQSYWPVERMIVELVCLMGALGGLHLWSGYRRVFAKVRQSRQHGSENTASQGLIGSQK